MDPLEDIPMLSQPALTEEGFVNPACMNELENWIANSAETYDRLKNDPEWAKKDWTFIPYITGALAKWATRQSPYGCADDLEIVVKYLRECLLVELDNLPEEDKSGDLYRLSLCQINKFLHDILGEFTPVQKWNECKAGDTPNISFTSRHDGKRDPDYDFIDLSALFHNVCLDLRDERRVNDAFDAKFEAEHGKANNED